MKEALHDTLPFTKAWLSDVLEGHFKSTCSIGQVARIGVGEGYLSSIFRVSVNWQSGDVTKLPASVVVKVPAAPMAAAMPDESTEAANAMPDFAKMFHNCECAVYELFAESSAPVRAPRLIHAREVSADHPGVLVMEDLSDRAKIINIVDGLTFEQAREVASQLAVLHAYSLKSSGWQAVAKEKWANWASFPDEFHKAMIAKACEALRRECPELFDGLVDRVTNELLVDTERDIAYIFQLHQQLGLPAVLVHGDLWCNNLLFRTTNKLTTSEICGIIDWQIAHPGCITEDFVRCFGSSLSAEMRREHTETLLRHYLSRLTKELGCLPPFTFDALLTAYNRTLKAGVYMTLPLLSFLTPEEKATLSEQQLRGVWMRAKCLIEDALRVELGTS